MEAQGFHHGSDTSASALSAEQRGQKFEAMIDAGATNSVVGRRTARRIARVAKEKLTILAIQQKLQVRC